jgi:hypothetical protein
VAVLHASAQQLGGRRVRRERGRAAPHERSQYRPRTRKLTLQYCAASQVKLGAFSAIRQL